MTGEKSLIIGDYFVLFSAGSSSSADGEKSVMHGFGCTFTGNVFLLVQAVLQSH